MDHAEILYDLAQTLPFHDLYLELGVQFAGTFRLLSKLFKHALAVDVNQCPVPDGAEFHQMSTNQFFDTFAPQPTDLIFIDADHHHLASWHDSMRALTWLKPITGLLVLHDTYPTNANELSQAYSGDSWRTAVLLRQVLGLESVTLPGMHGLTICRFAPLGQHLHWATNEELLKLGEANP